MKELTIKSRQFEYEFKDYIFPIIEERLKHLSQVKFYKCNDGKEVFKFLGIRDEAEKWVNNLIPEELENENDMLERVPFKEDSEGNLIPMHDFDWDEYREGRDIYPLIFSPTKVSCELMLWWMARKEETPEYIWDLQRYLSVSYDDKEMEPLTLLKRILILALNDLLITHWLQGYHGHFKHKNSLHSCKLADIKRKLL